MDNKLLRYLKNDLERSIISPKYVICVMGIIGVLIWGSMNNTAQILDNTIIFLLWWSTYTIRSVIIIPFCTIPYAGCFCEDLEYNYVRQVVIRGNLLSYCISKVVAIVISAISAFVIGMGSFVSLLSVLIPWIDLSDSVYQTAVQRGSFHNVLSNGNYFIYSLLFAFQLGMLFAILALISACASLYIANKLLVWSIPLLAYYSMMEYSFILFKGSAIANPEMIFTGRYNIFNNDLLSFIYSVFVMLIIIILLTVVVYRKLKRRISGD